MVRRCRSTGNRLSDLFSFSDVMVMSGNCSMMSGVGRESLDSIYCTKQVCSNHYQKEINCKSTWYTSFFLHSCLEIDWNQWSILHKQCVTAVIHVWILYKYGPVMRAISPRSILLLKIHKTHIARHHRSIFALLYVKCLWFKHIGLWIHTLLDSPI